MGRLKFLFAKFMKKIQLPAIRTSEIHKTAAIGSSSQITKCVIGKYTYVGNYTNVNHTHIGNYCSIADRCIIGGGNHPLSWVSTSPVFFSGRNIMGKNFTDKKYAAYRETFIGNDVWIGAGTYIRDGVIIGDGSVIGMGSVLTKDVGAYEIWAGNPAKFIRKRFDDEISAALQMTRWWEWEDEKMKRFASNIDDPNKFTEKVLKDITDENSSLG